VKSVPGQSYSSRADVPARYRWNPESIFANPEAWKAALDSLIADLVKLKALEGRLAEGSGVLAEALALRDQLHMRAGHVTVYASMCHNVDTADQAAAAMNGQANTAYAQYLAATAFVIPEILSLGRQQVTVWMDENPALQTYKHYFDDLFRQAEHIRSSDVEELLGMAADPLGSIANVYGVLVNADMVFAPAEDSQGEKHPLTQGTLVRLLRSHDRRLRQTAWENYHARHLEFKNTLINNLTASIKKNVFAMRARRHASTLDMALFDNNIPSDVFHNLMDVFRKNLPTWHRYWRLRREVLGVDTLRPFDTWAPLLGGEPSLSYEDAVEMICEGLVPMGESYVAQVRKACLEERWVDVYPTPGKRSGAFSSGEQGTPPFIVMSWGETIISLSTLAHELGHSMHSYLAWETQPHVYSEYSIFVAEVASNFHQALVRAHLLESDRDRAFKITLIEEAMSNFYRYFFTMPLLARFELETHQRIERGQGLTADVAIGLMADLFEEGFGGEVAIDHDLDGMHWSTYGHLYADYYVYQYATGISAAHALAGPILAGDSDAVDDYQSFLKAGASLYPIDALKLAGIDMTRPEPVETAFAHLSGLIDQLEQLLSDH
jgi:oligoendopeptidase F